MNAKPVFSNSDAQGAHAQAQDVSVRPSFQFSVRTLVALVTMAGMISGLVGIFVVRAREHARQGICLSQTRTFCMAVSVYESNTRRIPQATTSANGLLVDQPATQRGAGTDAGYSWQVQTLPYPCNEPTLSRGIRRTSENFALPAFDPTICNYSSPTVFAHASTVDLVQARCPSFRGAAVVSKALAPEYDLTHPAFVPGVALTNYVAFAGTHIQGGIVVENGVLISPKANGDSFLRLKDIADGVSRTLLVTESRERGYASWFDGTCAWVVGVPDGFAAGDSDGDGRLDMQRSPITAINYGSDDGSKVYLRAGTWGGQNARRWGPSSEHTSGQVVHGFADAHAKFLSAKVDATVYVQLITRAGGERVTSASLSK
jgi:hypothetical protein